MNILDKILELRERRGWTEYRLAEEAKLPQSTISSWYNKKMTPSFSSLEKICKAFNITLSQFFANENSLVDLTTEQREMLEEWNMLTNEQKKIIFNLLKTM